MAIVTPLGLSAQLRNLSASFLAFAAIIYVDVAQAEPPPETILVWRDDAVDASLALNGDEGAPDDLRSLRGQWAIVNFWATWCAPCVRELPALADLKAALAESGVTVLAINVNREGLRVVRPFLDRVGARQLDAVAAKGADAIALLGDEKLPRTLILNPAGKIAAEALGASDWRDPGFIAQMQARAMSDHPKQSPPKVIQRP